MVQGLLAFYSLVLAGVFFATWFFAFETRKTFRGGIFWKAWRIIATSLLFLGGSELVEFYEAVYGSSNMATAIDQSFVALASIMLLVGFYSFYTAWNPKRPAAGG